jgi:hypothetical protein
MRCDAELAECRLEEKMPLLIIQLVEIEYDGDMGPYVYLLNDRTRAVGMTAWKGVSEEEEWGGEAMATEDVDRARKKVETREPIQARLGSARLGEAREPDFVARSSSEPSRA